MIVNELIAKLEKLPGDLQVCVRAHNWSDNDLVEIEGLAEYVLVEEYFDKIVYITDEM